ncbi:hypothetical protein DFS34DRAFT_576125, partial [Phlyctochytrium arcticum]
RPQNEKELFNLRHESLQNALEQIFGINKQRFKIISPTQVQLVLALTCLHNIIRIESHGVEDEFDAQQWLNEAAAPPPGDADGPTLQAQAETVSNPAARRDQIANAMWANYIQTAADRRNR